MSVRVGVVGLRHGMASVVEVVRNPAFRLTSLCSRTHEAYDYLRGAPIAAPLESVTFTESRETLIAEARRHDDFAGVAFFDDYGRFLAEAAVDAVILAVPVHLNAAYARAALAAGKHVLTSKPFAMTLPDALALHRDVEAAKTCFMVNFEFRHAPLFLAIAEAIAAGRIGAVRLMSWNMFRMPFRPQYRRREWSGGPFTAEICHWLDLFHVFNGGRRFRRAAGFGGIGPMAGKQDFPDHGAAILDYEGDCVGSVNFSYFTDHPRHNQFAIVGETGKITGDTDGAGSFELFRDGAPPERRMIDPSQHHGHLGFDVSHRRFGEEIANGNAISRAEADAGLENCFACAAADIAMSEGRVVERAELERAPPVDDPYDVALQRAGSRAALLALRA